METNSQAFKILRILYLNRDHNRMSSKDISIRSKIQQNQISACTRIMVAKGLIKKERVKKQCYYCVSKNQTNWIYKILAKGMDEIENEKEN